MRKAEAYMTVEAVLVMPIVLGGILLTVYLLFFQYDRCLMEQNTAMVALRGCTAQITENKEIATRMLVYAGQEDNRYLAWSMEDADIQIKGNQVCVARAGTLKFPFKGLMFWNDDAEWGFQSVYKNYRICPVDLIRDYRKVAGGK